MIDMLSFFLGMVVAVVTILLYVGICEIVERKEQWNKVMYNSSSPSRDYWGTVLEANQPVQDEEEWIHVIPERSEPGL